MLSNKLCLPRPIAEALSKDSYSKGEADISVTELSVPSRVWALKKLHGHEIIRDVADVVKSFRGTAIHEAMQSRLSGDPSYIVETRFYEVFDGVKVGGQIDCLDLRDGTLYDWKDTKMQKYSDGVPLEWKYQAWCNKLLLQRNGHAVNRIVYCAWPGDYSKTQAAIGRGPAEPIQPLGIELQPDDMTVAWIKARIQSHKAALVSLPECSDEDRWARPAKWAVMKKGRKTAIKLYDSEPEATARAKEEKGYVEHRPSVDTRCVHYCECAKFCSYAISKGYTT